MRVSMGQAIIMWGLFVVYLYSDILRPHNDRAHEPKENPAAFRLPQRLISIMSQVGLDIKRL